MSFRRLGYNNERRRTESSQYSGRWGGIGGSPRPRRRSRTSAWRSDWRGVGEFAGWREISRPVGCFGPFPHTKSTGHLGTFTTLNLAKRYAFNAVISAPELQLLLCVKQNVELLGKLDGYKRGVASHSACHIFAFKRPVARLKLTAPAPTLLTREFAQFPPQIMASQKLLLTTPDGFLYLLHRSRHPFHRSR